MYIESVPNRDSPPAVLLRESYREGGKVRKRTLANLSCLSTEVVEGLKVLLRGGVAVPSAQEVFTVERSLPHLISEESQQPAAFARRTAVR